MVGTYLGNIEEVDRRLGAEVDYQSAGITQIRRAEDRQHEVGAARYAIEAQSLAEVFALARQAHGGGRVPQAGDADRGVEQKSRRGLHRTLALELQQAVQQVWHVAKVVEEVADASAQKARRDVAIAIDHRQEYPLVEPVVEVVNAAVPLFQRVVDVQRAERRALELALVQSRVELELAQWLLEAVTVDDHRGVGLAVVGIGSACTE
ncbi:hypothetical protein D3C71_1274350 [compost metagenome]